MSHDEAPQACGLPDREVANANTHIRGHSSAEKDPFDEMIEKTGCHDLNNAVIDCYYEAKDWRACKDKVAAFKDCFGKYQKSRDP